MTVDYHNPTIKQYKELIHEEARLSVESQIAKIEGDVAEERKLKQERKLIWNRILLMEAAFAIKNKKATA